MLLLLFAAFIAFVGIIASIGLTLVYVREPIHVTSNTITIKGLPPTLANTRLVHLTDLHYDLEHHNPQNHWWLLPYMTEQNMHNIVNRVNELNPDLVVLTGDYIVRKKKAIHTLVPFLRRINASKIAVLGNHDYLDSGRFYIANALREAGVHVLENSTAFPLGPLLPFVGLVDAWAQKHDGGEPMDPDKAFKGLSPNQPRVVLSHQPDTFEIISKSYRADLVLSGHTHGFQISIPVWDKPIFSFYLDVLAMTPYWFRKKFPFHYAKSVFKHIEWSHGLHRDQTNGNQLYVSKGLGSVLGFRLFCHPELAVHNLVPE
eukprot:m.54175 g.54175  ORF g.54175 m.54175 type:complete len:316 (+) comp18482_c0_seq3:71-1018(+)